MPDTTEVRRRILDRFGPDHPLTRIVLGRKDRLIWLDEADRSRARPRQLCLSLSAGRYRIEYWDGGSGELSGVELGSAPPLVLSPPGPGCFAILVAALGKD